MAKYLPGESGNYKGRPPGSSQRQKLFNALVEPRKEEIINTAINMALSGNEAMLKVLLDRLLPAKPKDEPLYFEIPNEPLNNAEALHQLALRLIATVASGELTPEQGQKLSSLIYDHYELIQTAEVNKRLDAIEEKNKAAQDRRK